MRVACFCMTMCMCAHVRVTLLLHVHAYGSVHVHVHVQVQVHVPYTIHHVCMCVDVREWASVTVHDAAAGLCTRWSVRIAHACIACASRVISGCCSTCAAARVRRCVVGTACACACACARSRHLANGVLAISRVLGAFSRSGSRAILCSCAKACACEILTFLRSRNQGVLRSGDVAMWRCGDLAYPCGSRIGVFA